MLDNEIIVTFSAENEFRRFLVAIGAKPTDIDNGRHCKHGWIFNCATREDAEALVSLFTEQL